MNNIDIVLAFVAAAGWIMSWSVRENIAGKGALEHDIKFLKKMIKKSKKGDAESKAILARWQEERDVLKKELSALRR